MIPNDLNTKEEISKKLNDLKEKIKKKVKFRVTCLHPVYTNGGCRLCGGMRICAHGHPMTIEEMNRNLVAPKKPYIWIKYCKYCYNEKTIGVLDEDIFLLNEQFGIFIKIPNEEQAYYDIEIRDLNKAYQLLNFFEKLHQE